MTGAAAVNFEEIAAAVAAIVGGGLGAWLFVRKVWPVVRSIPSGVLAFARGVITAAQVLDSVKGLPAFIERTDAQMAAIHHELHPNSGTSMNDAVRRTEARVAELGETSERLEVGVAGLYRKVDELAEVDDRLWSEIENTGGAGADGEGRDE